MKLQCPDCGKMVRNKKLFGTLHICISSYERFARNCQIAQRNAPPMYKDLGKLEFPEPFPSENKK